MKTWEKHIYVMLPSMPSLFAPGLVPENEHLWDDNSVFSLKMNIKKDELKKGWSFCTRQILYEPSRSSDSHCSFFYSSEPRLILLQAMPSFLPSRLVLRPPSSWRPGRRTRRDAGSVLSRTSPTRNSIAPSAWQPPRWHAWTSTVRSLEVEQLSYVSKSGLNIVESIYTLKMFMKVSCVIILKALEKLRPADECLDGFKLKVKDAKRPVWAWWAHVQNRNVTSKSWLSCVIFHFLLRALFPTRTMSSVFRLRQQNRNTLVFVSW